MTARSPQDSNSSKPDAGSIGLIVLVVLAGLASIVMLVSGSSAALKLALVAALWAAVLGFFLVVRYRRQAQESVTKLELQERAHRAELDAAAAHADSSALAARDDRGQADLDILEEIRSELASIRAQIEDLTGRDLTYEPAALHAEARRILELEAQAKAASEREYSQESYGAPSEAAISGLLGNAAHSASAEANPLSDIISEKIREHQSAPRQSAPAAASPAPEPAAEPFVEPFAEPFAEPVAEPTAEPFAEPVAEPTAEPIAKP
ncbi:MAG: PT domain-containing protein, partial [Corynebacterium flavescens]